MTKKLSNLQLAQQKAEAAVQATNQKINDLGKYTNNLYIVLTNIQSLFDRIRNVPEEKRLKYEELKAIQVKWKQQAEKIELEYKKAEAKTASQGAAGVGAGIAIVTLGPTVAMGVATTFGVASTGTAISTLTGAAATNAALAWLGGGALATGGGGMAAGSTFLALAGPIGWGIAGLSFIASGLMFINTRTDKKRLEDIYTLISERDVTSYELAIVELNERIKRVIDETLMLNKTINKIKTFGTDYNRMTEEQQYELGTYVNFMESSIMLLVNPILGLQPKFTEQDFDNLYESKEEISGSDFKDRKNMVISMANLLYKIDLDEKDKKLLAKSLRKNKEFLSSVQMTKRKFSVEDIDLVEKALKYKYETQN